MKQPNGLRYNSGKPRFDLLPPIALEKISEVLTFGATKYSEWNWAEGFKHTDVIASLQRHINAYMRGEDIDPETGLSHLAHAGCNIMFLLDLVELRPDLDNRPKVYKIEKTPITDKYIESQTEEQKPY